jgi:hypothetical protein
MIATPGVATRYPDLMLASVCMICQRGAGGGVAVGALDGDVCLGCARRLGHFVLTADHPTLSSIWTHARPRNLASPVAVAAAETHADLARAYLDMGLLADALEDAARALLLDPDARAAGLALECIFDARLFSGDGLARLRALLFLV